MIETLLAAMEWIWTRVDARFFGPSALRNFGIPLTVLAITIAMEIGARRNWRLRYGSRSFRIDMLYYIFYYSGAYHLLLFAWIYGTLAALVDAHAPWLKLELLKGMHPAMQVVVMVVVFDFLGYWSHRWRHASGTLWAFHAIHHSQSTLTVISNYRFHIVDETMLRLFVFLPFQMLGTGVEMWLLVDFALNSILLLQHSEWNWTYGRLGRVFVSPAFHRKHHSTDERLQNRNFGMLFTFWDDLFGTADRTSPVPATHGLAGHPVPETLWGHLVYPFAEIARGWRRPVPLAPPVATGAAEK